VKDKTSEHLAWVLSRLDSDNLNEMLSHNNNKIINFLVEKEPVEYLVWMFFSLNPTDLKKILKSNKALNSKQLADVLSWLRHKELYEVLKNLISDVLDSLLTKMWLENSLKPLTNVLLRLGPNALNDILTEKYIWSSKEMDF
jgi:Mg/Co/Ni transporter MgtE